MSMKDNMVRNVILASVLLIGIAISIGFSFAYFSTNIIGNKDAKPISVLAGTMELTFTEGDSNISLPNAQPGDKQSKTFKVENTGTLEDTYNYNIKLSSLNVTFKEEDLEYTLEEYTDDTYTDLKQDGISKKGFISKDTVNDNKEMYLATNIERPTKKGDTHYYKLTIEFKNLEDVNQEYNYNAEFSGKINIDDNSNAKEYIKTTPFSEIIVPNDSTIFKDDYENIRYAGADTEVNNYIWFNCDNYSLVIDATTAQTQNCEKWRIIGLFKNVTKTEGGAEDLVKIIRADSVGTLAWDKTGGTNGSNNWNRPADLKISLENYYGGEVLGSANGINQNSTRNMIEQVTWNLGGWNTPQITAQQFYDYERKENHYEDNPTTYNGYIGLIYPSDYGYATTGGDSSDRAACLTTNLGSYNSDCCKKDWLYISLRYQYTLTPYSDDSHRVFYVGYLGYVSHDSASYAYAIRPSLYLKSSVKVKSGEGNGVYGSSTNPYVLVP